MSDQCSSHAIWLPRLREHLEKEQYAAATIRQCMMVARQFLDYLATHNVEIDFAQAADVERYLQQARREYRRHHRHLPKHRAWRSSHTSGIHMLLRLVQGRWPPASVAVTPIEIWQRAICEEYARWMTSVRGLALGTVSTCCHEAGRFLNWLGERAISEELARFTVVDIDTYMKDRSGSLRRPSIKAAANRLRSFLRWLHLSGRSTRDLSSVVIGPTLYAFESIPSALRNQDVTKVLSTARKDRTPKGIRDYAILALLSTYGLRAGEIARLRLDDVDWRKESIRIRHDKTGATSYLPLLPQVGEAVLQYLQGARPKTTLREIFIRCRAPYRPFRRGRSLYRLVRRRLEAAGVNSRGKRGPHAFRHARAVSMLRAAVPVKEIGDLLGHRRADSTSPYLKLATEDLRAVALEIPSGVKA